MTLVMRVVMVSSARGQAPQGPEFEDASHRKTTRWMHNMNTLAARNDTLSITGSTTGFNAGHRHLRVPALAGLPRRAPTGTMTPRI